MLEGALSGGVLLASKVRRPINRGQIGPHEGPNRGLIGCEQGANRRLMGAEVGAEQGAKEGAKGVV